MSETILKYKYKKILSKIVNDLEDQLKIPKTKTHKRKTEEYINNNNDISFQIPNNNQYQIPNNPEPIINNINQINQTNEMQQPRYSAPIHNNQNSNGQIIQPTVQQYDQIVIPPKYRPDTQSILQNNETTDSNSISRKESSVKSQEDEENNKEISTQSKLKEDEETKFESFDNNDIEDDKGKEIDEIIPKTPPTNESIINNIDDLENQTSKDESSNYSGLDSLNDNKISSKDELDSSNDNKTPNEEINNNNTNTKINIFNYIPEPQNDNEDKNSDYISDDSDFF